MTAPLEILRLTWEEYAERYHSGTLGPAVGFPSVGIYDWPAEYWAVVVTDGVVQLLPAVVLNAFQVAGVIDRTVTPPKLMISAVLPSNYDASEVGPTDAEGFEPYYQVIYAADPAEAVAVARQQVEASSG